MSERRIRWLLIFLLVGQLVLLSAQVPGPGGRQSRLEGLLLRAVAPFAHLIEAASSSAASAGERFALRRELIEENRRLRGEVEALERDRVRTFGLEETLGRLTEALDYARSSSSALQVADIVYIDHASWLKTLVLAVGDLDVGANSPVVSINGLVGRVVIVARPYAKVQLITDRTANVGAMIQRTRRQGIVRGAGDGALEMAFVPLQADVRAGDRVITAGIDGVYPRGIPVGTVTGVSAGNELFHQIELVPSVEFGLLDQVFVLSRQQVPESLKEAEPDAQP